MKESVRAPTPQWGKGRGGAEGRNLGIGFLVGVCIPKKKRKGQDNWALSLYTQPHRPPPALHPQQRHIPLNNGHSDQRGIPALRLSLSLSRQSTGAKDGGHTGYSVSGILIGTQWSLTLCQLCVCVKASAAPLYADTHPHASTHTYTHTAHVPRTGLLYGRDPIAGGVRATIARAGICSRPAVETPANGRNCLKGWYWGV